MAARWIFLRLLGLTLFAAFTSFWVQAHGLVGEDGIVPAAERLPRYAAYFAEQGQWKWAQLPTLGWWAAGDVALHVFSALGCIVSVALIAGFAPRLMLGLGWLLYLSVFHIGSPFLSFQWDILLLESLWVAIPYAPRGWWPRLATQEAPSRLALWLVRLLLFKLILSSGVVKLTSGDYAWSDLTAMDYHYWTQPLPHGLAWYAHNAPDWTRALAVTGTFVVELFAPLLILFQVRGLRLLAFGAMLLLVGIWSEGSYTLAQLPFFAALALLLDDRLWRRLRPQWVGPARDARWPAFIAITGLMAVISATGNYGFFQLLTVALCLPLLDDAALRRLPLRPPPSPAPPHRLSRGLALGFALLILPLSALQLSRLAGRDALTWLQPTREAILEVSQPFASVNGYGLFATMTKQRIEIVVEGSADGVSDWKPYVFKYKPAETTRVGPITGLHMPRLDWQMWFAALSPRCRQGWYPGFIAALLRGSQDVRGLLAENPFPDRPPQAIRSRRLDYHFTDSPERSATGQVWSVRGSGDYCPVLTRAMLEEGK